MSERNILHLLNNGGGYPVRCVTEASKEAALSLFDMGIVSIETREVPRFEDNGRNIYTKSQLDQRVTAYIVDYTEAGWAQFGMKNV